MEKWVSKLNSNLKIAIALYARFPSEMAYGNHIIQVANGFAENNCEVNIYYPRTYNKKSIDAGPEEYYVTTNNIKFIMVDNFDITSFKLYELLPKFFQQFFYSINTFIWSKKLKENNGEDYLWSTNPNILIIAKKYFKNVIFEKHGRAKYIQRLSMSRLKNALLVGVTKQSKEELSKYSKNSLYLPNGVDENIFKFKKIDSENEIRIGYVGMLETYGVDKGVLDAIKKINLLNDKHNLFTQIVGGPEKKLEEIKSYINSHSDKEKFSVKSRVPHDEVPSLLNTLDIGIVPYPNDQHMSKYASPMKIFELAACGVPVLASNIDSHKELEEFELGILYFEHDNFDDFTDKLEILITNNDLRGDLSSRSLRNIKNLFWAKRMSLILESARSSTG